jgi:hypothetical protein
LSPWSPVYSFKTRLGVPETIFQLLSPAAGAVSVPPYPAFQWNAIENADRYELLVSSNITFENNVITKKGKDAIPGNAWQSDTQLDNGVTYYWKVRAIGAGSNSNWSAVGIFTIAPSPPGPTTPTLETSLSPPPESSPLTTFLLPSQPDINITLPPSPGTPLGLIYSGIGIGLVLISLLVIILVILIRRK